MRHSEELGNDHESSCLKAYELVLKVYELGLSDYFKRTQIVMVVIQSALFIVFGKLVQLGLTGSGNFTPGVNARTFILVSTLGVIAGLGAFSAWNWRDYIARRKDYTDFCRWYMRDIENHLIDLCGPDAPLQYFSKERDVFHRKLPIHAKYSKNTDGRPEQFPPEGPVKGGSMKIDKRLPTAFLVVWLSIFLVCLATIAYMIHNDLLKELAMSNITNWILAVAALFQACFAGVLLWYVKKQKGVMENQTKIMKSQNNINARQALLAESALNFSALVENVRILEKQRDMPENDEKTDTIKTVRKHNEQLNARNAKITNDLNNLPII